jgi:hypothetical protein
MPDVSFKFLQAKHEDLLQKQLIVSDDSQQVLAKEIREYIEETKLGAKYIFSNTERNQLRANLRYWANYLYSLDGKFPNTDLAPFTTRNKSLRTVLNIIRINLN